MYDTVKGSDWLGDQDAIHYLTEQAPQAIIEVRQSQSAQAVLCDELPLPPLSWRTMVCRSAVRKMERSTREHLVGRASSLVKVVRLTDVAVSLTGLVTLSSTLSMDRCVCMCCFPLLHFSLLSAQSLKYDCHYFIEYFALDLIMEGGECRGVMALCLEDGTIHRFRAKNTVLATG